MADERSRTIIIRRADLAQARDLCLRAGERGSLRARRMRRAAAQMLAAIIEEYAAKAALMQLCYGNVAIQMEPAE